MRKFSIHGRLVEGIRRKVVLDLFKMSSFSNAWKFWRGDFNALCQSSHPTPQEVLDFGKNLTAIFSGTSDRSRSQGQISAGGAAWEALVCWYLNLCLLETNCVVLKKHSMVPEPLSDALTVIYGSVPSNSESDLCAVTFPADSASQVVNWGMDRYKKEIAEICREKFSECELCVIQCKTNWNDNAQIPMLWDIVYSSAGFDSRASVGIHGWQVRSLKRFAYSFVTVPTTKGVKYGPDKTPVLRVKALSGGNFWGKDTIPDVALCISEMLSKNFSNAINVGGGGWHSRQADVYRALSKDFEYFKFF